MRVAYIAVSSARYGGTKVIFEHVSRLAARGHEASVWCLDEYPDWFSNRRPLPFRRFGAVDEVCAAMHEARDARIVATFWVTAVWVARSVRSDSGRFYLVQDIDQLTYSGDASGSSYRLGLSTITESDFVRDELQRLYGIPSRQISIGIDHDTFYPEKTDRDANRIFTAYRPDAGPNDLKGFLLAQEVARRVCAVNPRTSFVTFGTAGTPVIDASIPHVHVDTPDDDELRVLFSRAGCYLMTSKREGFCLPALEAMACGLPVVATYAGGNEEFCRNGATAMMGRTADDLARHVLNIQRDPALAAMLRQNGIEQSARYQWDGVIDRLETALLLG